LPLYEATCEEHGNIEAFAPMGGPIPCPVCAKACKKRIGSFAFKSGVLDQYEEFLAVKQKKQIEEQIATGQVESVTNRGPREFHPHYEPKFK